MTWSHNKSSSMIKSKKIYVKLFVKESAYYHHNPFQNWFETGISVMYYYESLFFHGEHHFYQTTPLKHNLIVLSCI